MHAHAHSHKCTVNAHARAHLITSGNQGVHGWAPQQETQGRRREGRRGVLVRGQSFFYHQRGEGRRVPRGQWP
eukprot:9467341-Pyramimonas_sp.AAC.1